MLQKTRKQFPKTHTLANYSCNRNEVFVNGFSADQKRELVRDLRKKYRGVRITRDARGEYIVYEDETRNIRSTYLSPEHLVRKVRIEKPKKTTGKFKGKVSEHVRNFNAMDLVTKLDFSKIYNAPRTPKTIIESLSPGRLSTKKKVVKIKPYTNLRLQINLSPRELHHSVSPEKKPVDIGDILDITSLPRDSTLNHSKASPSLNLSADSKENKLKEEEKKLNSFIDNLLSASYGDFDKIFESDEFKALDQEKIATLMIERFKRRKQELDEIAESNELSMDKFLERYLYYDPNPQAQTTQAQATQGQTAQAQTAQGQNDITPQTQSQDSVAQTAQAPQPKTINSNDEFQRDAGIIARQICFKDRLSKLLSEECQNSQTSLSVSSQDPVNQSAQLVPQNRSISRDYVRSSPHNSLTSDSINKFKEKLSKSFRKIYNQSISQSSSQLLLGQASSGENSLVARNEKVGSQSENLRVPGRRSRSPGSASRRDTSYPFAPMVSRSSTTPPARPPGITALNLNVFKNKDSSLDLSSVAVEAGIGKGSGRGLIINTPRNIQSAPTTPQGPGSSRILGVPTSRSAPDWFKSYSLIKFQDAVENPIVDDDQILANLIKRFILETPVQDSVSQSLDKSQDQLPDDSLDQSPAKSPKNSISLELEQITQAKIVASMKQKFSNFKAEYQKSNPPNSPQKINPDLYRKFLFETDEDGNDLQPPRTAVSNDKTVSVIFKALAICLVEAENIPNEIAKSPKSTESSPQYPPSNDSSIISSRSDHGGNVMTEILNILNDQKQSNLEGKSFEQQLDPDQLNLDQGKSFNQDKEGKIINRENFTQLLLRLEQIVSPEGEREVVVGALGAEVFKVDAELGYPLQNLDLNSTKDSQGIKVEVNLGFLLAPFEPQQTLKNDRDNQISLPSSPTQDPQNSSGGNKVGPEENTTPPPSPAQQKGSPGAIAAINAGIVSRLRRKGGFLSRTQVSESKGDQAGGGDISRLNPSIVALFQKNVSQNTSQDNTSAVRPLARIINMQSPPQAPVTVNVLFLPSQKQEDLPRNSSLPPAKEVLELGPTASPAFTASTAYAGGGSPAISGSSPQIVSPQGLSSVTTSNSGSPPISPASSASADGSEGGPASDSKIVSPPISPVSVASADGSAGEPASDSKIVSPPNSPALAGGSEGGPAGWTIEKVQADQVLFEYSIIPQDQQDDVNDQTNLKKDYDFFIQKSQEDEGKNTENKKTKIAISKTKFQKNDDQDPLPMLPQIKENEAKKFVKDAIINAIEKTKKSYSPHSQNSSSQEDKIYYDYLEIAIKVQGVKNNEFQFKQALREKGIVETEIGDHFEKAKLLSENFQKIAMTEFGIFTGRIGEVKSRVVGMRTKRIPLDLLNEVRRECSQPSNSPQDPDSVITCQVVYPTP